MDRTLQELQELRKFYHIKPLGKVVPFNYFEDQKRKNIVKRILGYYNE